MKGAIYSRVSTENQEYKRQTEELSEYAKRNGIEITHIFEEKESGFNKDRPQFKKQTVNNLLLYASFNIFLMSLRTFSL